jgi:tetratricopeptide (TPR) repeat protein
MKDAAMTNRTKTRTIALCSLRQKYLAHRHLTAAAKAGSENRPLIAALNRCATQNLPPAFQNPVHAFRVATSMVAISFLLSIPAPAQTLNLTLAQTRQQLLQALDSGQLRDAILLGERAVSRWPQDAQFRHDLGVAYLKSGDLKQAREQLTRARDLDPKDSATHFDLALVLLSEQDYAAAADALEASIKFSHSNSNSNANALAHILLGRDYLNSYGRFDGMFVLY